MRCGLPRAQAVGGVGAGVEVDLGGLGELGGQHLGGGVAHKVHPLVGQARMEVILGEVSEMIGTRPRQWDVITNNGRCDNKKQGSHVSCCNIPGSGRPVKAVTGLL